MTVLTERATGMARTAELMGNPRLTAELAQVAIDTQEANGLEVVDHGTRRLLDELTEECSGCEGIGGEAGGIDEPSWSCDRCRGRGRVPRRDPASMHLVQEDVLAFHETLELTIGLPTDVGIRDDELRADLILEEAAETAEAITGRRVLVSFAVSEPAKRPRSLAQAIDGLCDLLAVIYGAAVTFGIDLAPFWAEVHGTNMAKAGGPKREDGKQLKPEGWRPPDIAGLLEELHDYTEEDR